MIIRQETVADYDAVYHLILEAFATAEHTDGKEQNLVVALRSSEGFIPALSLVAEIDGEIVGHILFTRAFVGSDEVLALAPLSVKPAYQKQGIGQALIKKGHQIARELGYGYALVLGSEHYYPKSGYLPAETFGIVVPQDFPSANFMAIKLLSEAKPIKGEVIYAKEFGL